MLESAVLWRDEVGDGGIVKTEEGGGGGRRVEG